MANSKKSKYMFNHRQTLAWLGVDGTTLLGPDCAGTGVRAGRRARVAHAAGVLQGRVELSLERERTPEQTSLARDNVFSDGSSLQLATVTGDATNGYTAKLTVGV